MRPRLLLVSVVALVSCSTQTTAPVASHPLPAKDPLLSSVQPSGSFLAQANIYVGPGSKPGWVLSGYVEFTDSDCSMDLSIKQAPGLFKDAYSPEEYASYLEANPIVPLPTRSQLGDDYPLLGIPATQLVVKPFSDATYVQVSTPSPTAGVWVDSFDPLFPLSDPSSALPSTLLVANLPRLSPLPAAGPLLCSIPLLPYLAEARPSGSASAEVSFRYVPEKFCQFELAALSAGESSYRSNLDLSRPDLDYLSGHYAALGESCSSMYLSAPFQLTVRPTPASEVVYEMRTDSGALLYELTLTKTAPRRVLRPPTADSYFQLLAARLAAGFSLKDSLLYDTSTSRRPA